MTDRRKPQVEPPLRSHRASFVAAVRLIQVPVLRQGPGDKIEFHGTHRSYAMQQKAAINATVQIVKNGPYKVSGNLPMTKQTIGTNAAGDPDTSAVRPVSLRTEREQAVLRRIAYKSRL
jgi:hypothetical protein